MNISQLTDLVATPARMTAIGRMVSDRRRRVVRLDGMAGSMAAAILARLPQQQAPYLIVVNDMDEAGYLYSDLCQIDGEAHTLFFPSGFKRDIKYGQTDAPNEILRTQVLNQWFDNPQLRRVVTCPEALAERVATRNAVDQVTLTLTTGQTADITEVADRLRELGFTPVDYVYEPGQYAVRGSLIDIYSFAGELPYRIDFLGDEIDSIRTFNVETQLSERMVNAVSAVMEQAATGDTGVSLLDYVGDETMLICRDYRWMCQRVADIAAEKMSSSALIAGDGDTHALDKVVDPTAFATAAERLRRLEFSPAVGDETGITRIALHSSPQVSYHKNFDLIAEAFTRYKSQGYRLLIMSDSPRQHERLRVIFEDRGDDITFEPVEGVLHSGWVDEDLKLCAFTDHQIFDRFHKYSLRSDRARSGKLALSLKELNQIEVGDFIVHEDHGIGRFGGLVRTPVNGHTQEMVKLTYLGGDQIFVSIHSLHKLSKYRGREGEEPRLSKIGSGAWNKLKNRTKSRLKDIARDLIQLYARRRQEEGFAYSPDGYLQQELEASFEYEDTPDQLKATQEVKADMESSRPMDRLICGDVGFGKTEIAIRAAFKAAVDGKQTAVLVPTTVLALQHFNTFTARLRDLPVRVDYLSRARKPREVKQILADLQSGAIDIIIGTHKLIGKTVKFKDLGLLVIDEEQKFGVAVKEKLKQLRVNVDTLTMSATPIPRTLQFSLMGARDLSAITTPPANRYPIVTTLGTLNDDVVSEAINFELSRNGQVFIVSNRIDDLDRLAQMVERLVPDARIVIGHGQMPPEQLEQRILGFAAHDYDVLIATTIIESGLDMPNVNTILINNAQNYGLSDLHQMRGRVGRSSRKAFCYLLVPAGKPLTPVARRRLQAIESFSDLGSGIHIAMQDLDIRGAGNLLGAEQSGFIADLGYETYQKVLREAVIELKTEEMPEVFEAMASDHGDAFADAEFVSDTSVETDLELMLPAWYVPQEGERISLYRELDGMTTDREVAEYEKRLVDRFGPIPNVAHELIGIVPLRRTARTLGIEKIALKQGRMHLYFVGEQNKAYYQSPAFGRVLHYLQDDPQRCRLRDNAGRRSIIIERVPTVGEALAILRNITTLTPC